MPNDDTLIVNFAALQKASGDIQHALNNLDSQLTQLEQDAAPLVATWDGAAREAYDTHQRKWRERAADLSGMLRDIKVALDDSATDYQNTENRNTRLFS